MWCWPASRLFGKMRAVSGLDAADAAQRRGRGVIFASPHLGCWEMAGLYVSSRYPMTTLYRPTASRALENLSRERAPGSAHAWCHRCQWCARALSSVGTRRGGRYPARSESRARQRRVRAVLRHARLHHGVDRAPGAQDRRALILTYAERLPHGAGLSPASARSARGFRQRHAGTGRCDTESSD